MGGVAHVTWRPAPGCASPRARVPLGSAHGARVLSGQSRGPALVRAGAWGWGHSGGAGSPQHCGSWGPAPLAAPASWAWGLPRAGSQPSVASCRLQDHWGWQEGPCPDVWGWEAPTPSSSSPRLSRAWLCPHSPLSYLLCPVWRDCVSRAPAHQNPAGLPCLPVGRECQRTAGSLSSGSGTWSKGAAVLQCPPNPSRTRAAALPQGLPQVSQGLIRGLLACPRVLLGCWGGQHAQLRAGRAAICLGLVLPR